MLSDESRKAIDSLSKEDLRLEVNKAHRSRFQSDKFAYLQARLQHLVDDEESAKHQTDLDLAAEANRISRDANRIADDANAVASKAWRTSVLAVIVAIVAIVVSILAIN